MPRIYIEDGLTLEASVRPTRDGLQGGDTVSDESSPEIKITFRPPLSVAVIKHHDGSAVTDPEKYAGKLCKYIGDHLVSWDVEDKNGEPVPITPAALHRIPAPYLYAMENAITEGNTKTRAIEKN